MRPSLVALFSSTLLLFAGPARAQDEPEERDGPAAAVDAEASADPSETASGGALDARAHFEQGLAHYHGRRFREAIREFELAARIVPTADLWFNIAKSHEELSEFDQAIEYYRRYLRDRVNAPDAPETEVRIEDLTRRAEEQREARRRQPTTGTLRIRGGPPGGAIALDGRPAGRTPLEVPVTLPGGSHRLDVEQEGHIPFRAQVAVEPGVATVAYPDLSPMTRYRSQQGSRLFTWIVAGLSGAAAATSFGLAMRARSLNADMRWADARDGAALSDYALAGAITLGVGAVILYFIEGRSLESEPVTVAER